MNNTRRNYFTRMKQYRTRYLMLLPGVLLLFFMNYLPMFGNIIAFKEIDYSLGILGSRWIGLKNFDFLFSTPAAWVALRNTLFYNVLFIFTGIAGSVGLSIALSEIANKRAAKVYQVILIMPHFISMVVVSYLVYAFLSHATGFMNTEILPLLGIEPIGWYMEAQYWPYILFIVNMWKTWGYGTVIYLAAIAGIDPALYEAAKIDGASKWRQIKAITIPQLMPVISMLFLLSLGRIFNSDFGLFYQVPRASGALISTTQTLDTFVYRSLIQLGDIGMSYAAALFQNTVGFVTILVVNMILRKVSPERSLF